VLHRVGWAALLLWIIVLARKLPLPLSQRDWGAFLVMGALNNAIPFGLMTWGQLVIETGLTSILNAATAIFGVLVAAMVFADEKLTARKSIGVAFGFCGVATAIGLEALASFDARSLGQLAVLAGTVSYAFAAAWGRKTLSHLPPLVAAAGMLTGATLLLFPLTLWVDGLSTLVLSPTAIGAIA
jgi:drug/metabolite transporter (DMT)-like permease